MPQLDETHDARLRSWIESANARDTDFPIQNLPFGVFRRVAEPRDPGRVGVAIGDQILDVGAVADLIEPPARQAAEACRTSNLNRLMALGRAGSGPLRTGLSRLLRDDASRPDVEPHLTPVAAAELLTPVEIGDYTDFYASVFHATNVGRLFRPDAPLTPNYKWVPIAYHGRASSIIVSGGPVRRPSGQIRPPGSEDPVFEPSRALDYELELGILIGDPSEAGSTVPIERADEHIFGACLFNDWSARDIQAWEYQPLGPFLSKSFASTMSPWVVTSEALAPFRTPAPARPEGDPAPLPYLWSARDQAEGAIAVELEALVCSARMKAGGLAPVRLSLSDFAQMYWTAGQMVAHHASNGCALRTGDLLGSGTVSGPDRKTAGCLLEITNRGAEPVRLSDREMRGFLEDGDEVILRGRCRREGFASIGFGECRGVVLPAA